MWPHGLTTRVTFTKALQESRFRKKRLPLNKSRVTKDDQSKRCGVRENVEVKPSKKKVKKKTLINSIFGTPRKPKLSHNSNEGLFPSRKRVLSNLFDGETNPAKKKKTNHEVHSTPRVILRRSAKDFETPSGGKLLASPCPNEGWKSEVSKNIARESESHPLSEGTKPEHQKHKN